MGLGAFGIAIIAGLAVDNPVDNILSRALVSMLACNFVGLLIGTLAERAVVTSIESYAEARPVHEHLADVDDSSGAPVDARRAAA